jgi:predicted Zn-dependent protease
MVIGMVWVLVLGLQRLASSQATISVAQHRLSQNNSVTLHSKQLPSLRSHPLPPSLVQWQDLKQAGDYSDQINPTDVGALIWSEFPIRIYIESPSLSVPKAEAWRLAVLRAIDEWTVYLPLTVVLQIDEADIIIKQSAPPLRLAPRQGTATKRLIERVRSAETRYDLFIRQTDNEPAVLTHRHTIFLSPTQAGPYVQSAARHELGHALGIWGHSQQSTDVMFFSQVQTPGTISARDVNTLKQIYKQPTGLGWPLP